MNAWSEEPIFDRDSHPILDPIPVGEIPDTLTLCLGQNYFLSFGFEGAYTNQQIALDWDVNGGADVVMIDSVSEGTSALWQAMIIASEENIGIHTLSVSGSDVNLPGCFTTITIFFEVLDVTIPPLLETDTLFLCEGFQNLVEATSGYDSYDWNNGCQSAICQFNEIGLYVVTGQYQGCTAVDSVVVLPSVMEECWVIGALSLCPGELATISMCEGVAEMTTTFDWEVLGDGNGSIVEDQDSVVWVTAGTYHFQGYSLTGCHHIHVFHITESGAFFPEDEWSQDYCSLQDTVHFEGASELAQNGYFNVHLNSTDPGGWNGDTLNFYVNGELVDQLSPFYTFEQNYMSVVPGDYVELEFVGTSGLSENYGLVIYDCEFQNYTILVGPFSNGEIIWSQTSACEPEPVEGLWQVVSGPEGGVFSSSETFNTSFNASEWGEYQVCFMYADCPELSPCYTLNFNGCIVWGCTDSDACNYDPEAVEDDGSCEYLETFEISGPTDLVLNDTAFYSYPFIEGFTYEWQVSGGEIIEWSSSTEIVVNWYMTSGGYVKVIVTDPYGCSAQTTLGVYISPTSVHSLASVDWQVYPIPADETIFILLPAGDYGASWMRIVDITGKTMYEDHSLHSVTINCAAWANGMYMIMLQTSQGISSHCIEVSH